MSMTPTDIGLIIILAVGVSAGFWVASVEAGDIGNPKCMWVFRWLALAFGAPVLLKLLATLWIVLILG
jgi:hypothetical protein